MPPWCCLDGDGAVPQGGKFAPTVLGFAKQLEETNSLGGMTLSEAKDLHEAKERQKKATGLGSTAAKAGAPALDGRSESKRIELSARQMKGMAHQPRPLT